MKRALMLMLAPLLLAGCVKEQVVSGGTSAAGLGAPLVVEHFMRAVNAQPRDLATMGRLFGTKDGPLSSRDPRPQVEQRMFAIGAVLQHEDYEIVREQLVPGRTTEATQFIVRVTRGNRSHNVPFTLVRYQDGWLIEQIGIDAITNER